jgi:hypothetical protein
MPYGDMRDQMHPRVARTVPSTPEAIAILNKEPLRPLAFGGLVTKLVEFGAIEAPSMESIRDSVSGLLNIDGSEFDERLADGEVINGHKANAWVSNYRERAENRLRNEKTDEARTYFQDYLFNSLDDPNSNRLTDMVQTERDRVASLEAEIQELESRGALAIHHKMELDRIVRPKLTACETSRYAIQLPELLEILLDSSVLFEHGDQMAHTTIRIMGHTLENLRLFSSAELLQEWFKGAREFPNAPIDVADAIGNIWLPEVAAVNMVARGYVDAYYAEDLGLNEIASLPNPIEEALYITDDEATAFFLAFPLANSQQPR